jgi:tetratricopeptide (TPR) repeat protein
VPEISSSGVPEPGVPRHARFVGVPCALLLLAVALAPAGCGRVGARSLAREGNEHYRAGRYEEAIARFEAALRLEPNLPVLSLHLGYAAMALGSTQRPPASERSALRASRAFARFMELAPRDERGPRFYLQCLLDAGRTDEAIAFLRRQHEKNPRDLATIASLGAVCSRAGRADEALAWYEKRAALLPGEAKAHYLVGTLLWERLHRDESLSGAERVRLAERGLRAVDAALRLQPGSVETLVYRGLLLRERARGRPDETSRKRDLEEAERSRAQALERMGRGAKGAAATPGTGSL